MGHFLLSMVILAAAVALYWRARYEPGERPLNDRRIVLATRALLPLGAPRALRRDARDRRRPASRAAPGTGEIVPRIDLLGLDALIHWHGRTGTLLGLASVGAWFIARRLGADPQTCAAR